MKTKHVLLCALTAVLFNVNSHAQTVPSYVPTNGLVGWWPFNGNANDESGNNNNGTVNGAALTSDRFGNANSAYSFDGASNHILIPNNSNLSGMNDISISGWVKITALPNSNNVFSGIVTKWYGTLNCNQFTDNYAIWVSSTLKLVAGCNNYQFYPSTTLNSATNVSQWVHFVYVHKNNQGGQLFLNGQIAQSNTVIGNICNSANPLYIGCDNGLGSPNRFFNGNIDDIGIWNRALTQQEITNLYNSTSVGLNEFNNSKLFSVYPNPAKHQLNIKADALLINSAYSIYDYTGKLILSGKLTSENTIVDLNNLPQGIYMLSIGDNNKQTFKIVRD